MKIKLNTMHVNQIMIRTTVVVEVAEGAMLLEVRPSPAAVVQAEHAYV